MKISVDDALPIARDVIEHAVDRLEGIAQGARDDVASLLQQHEGEIANWIASGNVPQLNVIQFRVETILRRAAWEAVREARVQERLVDLIAIGVRIAIGVIVKL